MNRIKELRLNRNYSQTEIAELLNMEQANYSKYERGVKQLGVKTIIKLCKIYNVSADYLLELSDELKPLF